MADIVLVNESEKYALLFEQLLSHSLPVQAMCLFYDEITSSDRSLVDLLPPFTDDESRQQRLVEAFYLLPGYPFARCIFLADSYLDLPADAEEPIEALVAYSFPLSVDDKVTVLSRPYRREGDSVFFEAPITQEHSYGDTIPTVISLMKQVLEESASGSRNHLKGRTLKWMLRERGHLISDLLASHVQTS